MRIMTWNIHGASLRDRDTRFPLIKEAIEKYKPDVACFQEAFFPKSRKMLKNIAGYHASYQTNWFPFPPVTTRGGLITLTKAQPLEVNYHPYLSQGNWFTEQRWDRLIGKGFLETIIEDDEFGKVTVINTHKVCTYTKDADTDIYLEAQTAQLLERIKKRKEKGEFIILAGDLNFQRPSKLYPQVKGMLHDATENLQLPELHKLHLFEYQTVDYIFTGDKQHCEARYIYHESWQKYPSDHPGIVVDL